MKPFILRCLGVGLVFFGLPVLGVAEDQRIIAEQSVERRVIVRDAQGFETVRFEPADVVKPGDYLRYTLKYENRLNDPAEAIVLVMPVPAALDFIPGSVLPLTIPYQISVDGGVTFIAVPENFPADARVTHIRWAFDRDVAVGEHGDVSYAAILK